MELGPLVFYFFAALAVVGAGMMVTRKNAVHSAIYLVLTFVSISAIYVLLGADFLFVVQILVYAGGIMVLFLFVIMLVNLEDPKRTAGGRLRFGFSTIVTLVLFGILATVFLKKTPEAVGPLVQSGEGNLELIGQLLYREYLLPFEAISLLLLVAMIGAVILARPRA